MTPMRCYILFGGDGGVAIGRAGEGAGVVAPNRAGWSPKRAGFGLPWREKAPGAPIRGAGTARRQFDLISRQFCYDR